MSLIKELAGKYAVIAGDVVEFPGKKKESGSKVVPAMPNFHDGQYLTAKEKENIFKSYVRFVNSGFEESKFTKNVYRHLSITGFNFIAHYDIKGFYRTRFADPDGRIKTYGNIAGASHWAFNDDNTSGCGDLNKAIHDFTVKSKSKFIDDAKELKKQLLIEQHKKIGDQLKDMGHDV